MLSKTKAIIKLIRVKQYIKNLLIFLPLFFSGQLLNGPLLLKTIIGFLVFSLVASVVYIINDLNDIEKDKKHPKKKFRPLASGAINKQEAFIIAAVLGIGAAVLAWVYLPLAASIVLALYLGINIIYSTKLKHVPLVDVAIVAAGFYLRLLYGGEVSNIELSSYILLTVTFLSLFMAFGKRRNELVQNGASSRKVLAYYTKDFLDKNMYVMAGLSITFYAFWVISVKQNDTLMAVTIPLAAFLMIRYSFQIEKNTSDGDPSEVLLSDKVLIVLGAVLATALVIGLYVQ